MLDADRRRGNGELLLVAAGEPDATSKLLGQLRLNLAKKDGLLEAGRVRVPWVVDFPLLEWDAEEKRYVRDAPPVHVAARRGLREARHRARRRRAPRPTTWC